MRKPVMKIGLQMHMVFPSILKKKDIFKHEWPLLAVDSIGCCPLSSEKQTFRKHNSNMYESRLSASQSFATPMQFDWDGGSQTGWLWGMTFKECEAQKALV
jgi:hypothetical protein